MFQLVDSQTGGSLSPLGFVSIVISLRPGRRTRSNPPEPKKGTKGYNNSYPHSFTNRNRL